MHWANVWPALSALFTGFTTLIALWAILRWRKQEELKARLNFKLAIASYSFQLTQMPVILNALAVRHEQSDNAKMLNELLSACNNAWLVCEGLLDGNKTVRISWDYIFNNNALYLNGKMDSNSLGAMCMAILHEKFVFN